MKLYLASMHPSNREALLGLLGNPSDASVLLIPNAWDTYPRERFETELGHTLDAFRDLGLTTSQLDLKSATKASVREALKGKALVWVMAGNTFYLNYYLHKSGFAEIIKDAMKDGLVYGGESAGAAVAGVTLHGVEKMDDPKDCPEVIWEGLSLVDQAVLPHWNWEKYRAEIEAAKAEMEKFVPVVTITNQQALVVIDRQQEIVENPTDEV